MTDETGEGPDITEDGPVEELKAEITAQEYDPADANPDKSGAVKKERKIFKGDKVPLQDVNPGAFVQVIDRDTMDGKAYRLPGMGIVKQMIPSWRGKDYVCVTMVDAKNNWRQVQRDVKTSNIMNVLTGRMGDELRAAYKEYASANLEMAVSNPGLTLGSDPEIFVVDKDNQVIPAWKLFGPKDGPTSPHSTRTSYRASVYWDGFQAEFTTPGGMTCMAYFMDAIYEGLAATLSEARKVDKGAKLSISSVLPVPRDLLENPETPDKYVQFGCMPSKNAYGLSGRNLDGRQVPIRFAGGHIHFGIPNAKLFHRDDSAQKRVVWAMDAILGVACVSLFENWDNPVRREFYGLPGEYRLPPHGLEYRTLSNAWLAHPTISNMVYELARRAFAMGYWDMMNLWDTTEGETLDCILRSDVEIARKILARNKDVFEKVWNYKVLGGDVAYKVFSRDMSETIKDPADIEGNWLIGKQEWVGHNESPLKNWSKSIEHIRTGKKL